MELKFDGLNLIKLYLEKLELLNQKERDILIDIIKISNTPIIYYEEDKTSDIELRGIIESWKKKGFNNLILLPKNFYSK